MRSEWRDYHEATQHTVERLRSRPHGLDWDNMPDPFRHYSGVPVIDLPAEMTVPPAGAMDVLSGVRGGLYAGGDAAAWLSGLFFHSAAISATKVAASGYRYALRVNASSGNLHPTEFHLATRGLQGWPDGLFHYQPSAHMAEQRGTGDFAAALSVDAPLVIVLTSILWREAWKYGRRAYRYCLLDAGHAAEAVALAARAHGADAQVTGDFDDDAVQRLLGLEDEWPMLLIAIRGLPARAGGAAPPVLAGGVANTHYPMAEPFHESSKPSTGGEWSLTGSATPAVRSEATFAQVVRRRRSALDFEGGSRRITREQLQTLVSTAEYGLRLYVYVHRVEGMEPGLYTAPDLRLVRAGDQRVTAAGLSLQQALAGNSCVTFSILADLEEAAARWGDRGYRYCHFAAGATGQRLYLAAEAMGFQSTGIGAFFDDAVHDYVGARSVIYHFACGFAVRDPRLGE